MNKNIISKYLKRTLAIVMSLVFVLSGIILMDKPLISEAASGQYNDDMAWEVLDMVNKERAARGLSSLTMDQTLVNSAKVRAPEISEYFSHTRPNGTSCFTAYPSAQMSVGENIAAGQYSASAVMNSWMNSQGHRENILDSGFKSIGIACYYIPGSDYGYYWVQCFGDVVTAPLSNSSSSSTGNTSVDTVDYSSVYDYSYYINKYSDLKSAFGSNQAAAFNHFINNGMNEGRQASEDFNVSIYKANYADLRAAYGNDLKSYYLHYINHGKKEGRNAKTLINNSSGTSTTVYNGVDYSAVYDYNYYINKYPDLKAAFEGNPTAALNHFVNCGMNEGRQAKATFNASNYKNKYADLCSAFGGNMKCYYIHYISCGQNENRNCN
ncbi:MAG: CAP domain-containing protein [Lachnospiraceae bacterium]|nr:CAP domain-containing protein [Lachnospiraceae bacterium]